jgi:DNA-binding transcriptional regulator GbsR (MarR family)
LAGRVYGWLLICDPPQQSLTDLAQMLWVSKASVSTVARQLQEGGMIERLPSSTRQHLYRVTPGGFTSVLNVQLSRMRLGIEAADFGLALLNEDRPSSGSALRTSGTSASSPHRTTETSWCSGGSTIAPRGGIDDDDQS